MHYFIQNNNLVDGYHSALIKLANYGKEYSCSDWNTKCLEIGITMHIENPISEPRISKLSFCEPYSLEKYCQEITDGILDFEIEKGKWAYTYHNRMVDYGKAMNQINFIIEELKNNPDSRRAVIDIRDNFHDANSSDPACLQHIQFFIRDNCLNMCVLFRSNDACKATFMNMFALVRLQEKIAEELNISVGSLTYTANSFHCYERDYEMLRGYCERISYQRLSELSYSYEDDWKELMENEKQRITKEVKKLKNES